PAGCNGQARPYAGRKKRSAHRKKLLRVPLASAMARTQAEWIPGRAGSLTAQQPERALCRTDCVQSSPLCVAAWSVLTVGNSLAYPSCLSVDLKDDVTAAPPQSHSDI